MPLSFEKWKSCQAYAETSVKRAAPTATRRCVRRPASRSLISRSTPIAPPRTPARTTRSSTSAKWSSGTHGLHRVLLSQCDLLDPGRSEVEQLVELVAVERRALGRRLDLDQTPVAGHDDVDVHLGGRVLRIVEVEDRVALDDSDRDGADGIGERLSEAHVVERPPRSDVSARDRRAPRAAVRLDDVAVDPERPLAERVEIGDGTQCAADQPLD